VALFAVVIFTTVGKVYSPQFVLWLTPLAVIALTNSRQQITFWFWQASEIIYHLAIWQYLALFTGAQFGLPAGGYVIAIALRVVGISCFTYVLMRDLAATIHRKTKRNFALRAAAVILSLNTCRGNPVAALVQRWF